MATYLTVPGNTEARAVQQIFNLLDIAAGGDSYSILEEEGIVKSAAKTGGMEHCPGLGPASEPDRAYKLSAGFSETQKAALTEAGAKLSDHCPAGYYKVQSFRL